jgi:hypothetical protein
MTWNGFRITVIPSKIICGYFTCVHTKTQLYVLEHRFRRNHGMGTVFLVTVVRQYFVGNYIRLLNDIHIKISFAQG